MQWNYKGIPVEVICSRRRTLALQVYPDGTVKVRAPYRVRQADILRLLAAKEDWLLAALQKAEERAEKAPDLPKLTDADRRRLANAMKAALPDKLDRYAALLHVRFGRVTVRFQTSRWGSCSSQGNLNFNALLMLAPEPVLDYVIVHELCHRLEMNHSPRFWALVESILPDYKERRKWLRTHQQELMGRL